MRADPDCLNFAIIELSVGRVAVEVFDEQLQSPSHEFPGLELHPGAQGKVGAPMVLLFVFEINSENGGDRAAIEAPGASEFDTILNRLGL